MATKAQLNLIGPQVRKWREKKDWSQEQLAAKLQLRGWSLSRDSIASLELCRRRVPDAEMLFLARVFGVQLEDLFPRNLSLSKVGPEFQSGGKIVLHPTRGER